MDLDALAAREGMLSAAARESLARLLLIEADAPPFTPPRILALALGFRLRLGCEATTGEVLVYPWLPDPRLRGGVHHRELARGYLLRHRLAHVDSDVRGLATEIALPVDERVRGYSHLVWHQRAYPEEEIAAVAAVESGVTPTRVSCP